MLKYAISTTSADIDTSFAITLRGSEQECVRRAAALGYEGVELNPTDTSVVNLKELRAAIRDTGVKCAAIATGLSLPAHNCLLSDKEPEKRKTSIDALKHFINLAHEISSDIVIGQYKGRQIPFAEIPDAKERLRESLLILSDYAQGSGVNMLLEAVNMYFSTLMNSAAELGEYIRTLKRENIRLHIDSHHMNMHDRSALALIRKYKDVLGYVHLSESNRYPIGYGTIDFYDYIAGLSNIAYNGFATVEVIGYPSQDKAAAGCLSALKELEQRYESRIIP